MKKYKVFFHLVLVGSETPSITCSLKHQEIFPVNWIAHIQHSAYNAATLWQIYV